MKEKKIKPIKRWIQYEDGLFSKFLDGRQIKQSYWLIKRRIGYKDSWHRIDVLQVLITPIKK